MKKHIVFDCDGTLIDTSGPKYRLYPGIKELLMSLSSDYKLYVWTARDRLSTLRILQDQQVFHLFEEICTADDAFPKPHVAGLAAMVGNEDKSHICMIGDTSNDILGAKNFGIKSIGASWNCLTHPDILKVAGASFITNDPAECLSWILKNI